jgi:hypothetical protein
LDVETLHKALENVLWCAVFDKQATSVVGYLCGELTHPLVEYRNAAIPRVSETIQDCPIENEQWYDRVATCECSLQTAIIIESQITPKPKDGYRRTFHTQSHHHSDA